MNRNQESVYRFRIVKFLLITLGTFILDDFFYITYKKKIVIGLDILWGILLLLYNHDYHWFWRYCSRLVNFVLLVVKNNYCNLIYVCEWDKKNDFYHHMKNKKIYGLTLTWYTDFNLNDFSNGLFWTLKMKYWRNIQEFVLTLLSKKDYIIKSIF